MPVSKKPPKKTSSSKKSANTVTPFPDLRGMEGVMADVFGSHSQSPLDQAQELMYDAWEKASPKKRIALAEKALEVSPLCADAYTLLAEETSRTPKEALALYQQAVDAGSEALGPDGFREYAGHFWGFLETRSYMRARAGLGEALWATGQREAAITNFKEMLELNPDDNQGIRYVLAAKLLDMGNIDDLKTLLEMYWEDYSADIQYTRALIAFSDGADNAGEIAEMAWQTNNYVPDTLSSKRRPVPTGDYILKRFQALLKCDAPFFAFERSERQRINGTM